jgi:hypothetical protein
MWQQKDTMRQRGNDFGVIPRKFNDEKRNDAAALQPRTLTAIFRPRPKAIGSELVASSREETRQKQEETRQKQNEGAVNALRHHQG